MKVVVFLLTGLVLTSYLFDLAWRRRLRRSPHEQLEKRNAVRTAIWSMRLRHVLIGALVLALVVSVGNTTHDRWFIFGVTSAVVLPIVGAMLWFNAEITRVLRRRLK